MSELDKCLVMTASGLHLSEPLCWEEAIKLAEQWASEHADCKPIWVARIAYEIADENK